MVSIIRDNEETKVARDNDKLACDKYICGHDQNMIKQKDKWVKKINKTGCYILLRNRYVYFR